MPDSLKKQPVLSQDLNISLKAILVGFGIEKLNFWNNGKKLNFNSPQGDLII